MCISPFLFIFQAKYLTKKTQAGSVEAIRLLDELLLQLVVSLRSPPYISMPFIIIIAVGVLQSTGIDGYSDMKKFILFTFCLYYSYNNFINYISFSFFNTLMTNVRLYECFL